MKSSGWSSLVLGTILATSASLPALAQQTAPASAPVAASLATPVGSADMVIDPAVVAAAAIDAAVRADAIADEEVDRIMTGSIFPVEPGPRTGGLSEIRPPAKSALSAPQPAPEPAKPQPTRATAALSSEAPVATPQPAEATPAATEPAKPADAAAPAPAEAASEPVKPAEAAVTPTEVAPQPSKPTETAAEPVKPADVASEPAKPVEAAPVAEAPKSEAPAAAVAQETAKPAEAAAAPTAAPVEKTSEAAPATPTADKAAEAAPASEPARAETAAVAPQAAEATPVAAVPAAPAAAAPSAPVAVAPSTSVAVAPAEPPAAVAAKADEPLVPAQAETRTATHSTASEPAKPAEPVSTATTATATNVPAAPSAPAAPVAAPSKPSTDAAITATLAAEQAAAALKAALEELQPLAGAAEERADRAALLAFYADRAFLPLFVDAQGTTDRGRAALGALARSGEDGLEPRDYALPRIEAGIAPDPRADAEILFARTVVRYARHLQTGRFDPGRVHELVTPTPNKTEAREVLGRVAGASDVFAALQTYAPPHTGYKRLKAMLADLRGAAPEPPMVMLPVGPTLKPGQRDARVALLRERLGVGETATDAEVFDPALATAVKTFQRERGLSPTGAVGRETVSALNGEKTGTAARISDIVSNMERWRWLPRDLGELHVFVNVPDFHLDVMKDGRSIHHARVVVGRPSNPTPIFSDTMRHVVVNPYWNVPYSIVKKEMIGKLQSTAGQSLGRSYEVRVGRQVVDPATVDWATVNAANVSIRQLPGDGNALGNIKFLFPNQHAVYLHDTSSRSLFSQSFRALSHGCVRVHEPFSFADAVLSEEPDKVDGAKLKKMIGGGEKTINLKRLIPVHIAYFTAWVDDAGQLQNRPDVYGHDAKVKRLLGL